MWNNMKKDTIINLINKIIWSKPEEKNKYKIQILDRLSPNMSRVVSGESVKRITKLGGLELDDGTIVPLHRIKRITYENRVILERK